MKNPVTLTTPILSSATLGLYSHSKNKHPTNLTSREFVSQPTILKLQYSLQLMCPPTSPYSLSRTKIQSLVLPQSSHLKKCGDGARTCDSGL